MDLRLNDKGSRAVMFYENERSAFFAVNDGHILRIAKATGRQRVVKPEKDTLPQMVRIAGEFQELRRIIITATSHAEPGGIIAHRDGDVRNCAADNLYIIRRKGREKPVEAINAHGEARYYKSIKAASEAFRVSRSTLTRAKHSQAPILKKFNIIF